MAGAALTHIRLGEPERAAPALFLFAMALLGAVERFGPYSF